jgi:hypothetical protein
LVSLIVVLWCAGSNAARGDAGGNSEWLPLYAGVRRGGSQASRRVVTDDHCA